MSKMVNVRLRGEFTKEVALFYIMTEEVKY